MYYTVTVYYIVSIYNYLLSFFFLQIIWIQNIKLICYLLYRLRWKHIIFKHIINNAKKPLLNIPIFNLLFIFLLWIFNCVYSTLNKTITHFLHNRWISFQVFPFNILHISSQGMTVPSPFSSFVYLYVNSCLFALYRNRSLLYKLFQTVEHEGFLEGIYLQKLVCYNWQLTVPILICGAKTNTFTIFCFFFR